MRTSGWKHSTLIAVLAVFSPATFASSDPTFDKPLCVMVFDKTCHAWCDKVRPVVAALEKQYGDRVAFAEIDVTQSEIPAAKKKAAELGILSKLEDYPNYVPLVVVFETNRKKFKELVGPKPLDQYETAIQKVLGENGKNK